MLKVPNNKLLFRLSDKGGWEWSDNGGTLWYLTFRTEREIRDMWPGIEGHVDDAAAAREAELEVLGDTLDEPIPEDFEDILLDTY